MKKLILMLMILLSISSVKAQETDYFREGIDFKGIGTEPFWGVRIDAEKGIYFDNPAFDYVIETGVPKFVPIMDVTGFAYIGESEKYSIHVQVIKQECSDGMSDNVYPYAVKVMLTDKVSSDISEFNGCGSYTADLRLNDIWVLESLNGKEITKEQYMKKRPYVEFKLDKNRIGGNSGCNNFFGKVEVKSSKIVIDEKIGSTMMACPDMSLEKEFTQTIAGKTLDYKIENGGLYFYEDGKEVMKFKKAD